MFPHVSPPSRRQPSTQASYDAEVSPTASLGEPSDSSQELPPEVDHETSFEPSAQERLTTKPPDVPRPGFDDYGAELDKEARIWSTYVKEAEQWDEEMVDGWNRSLDVILATVVSDILGRHLWIVFAALFSAISTTFVVESITNLQPDPSTASATALVEITQILRAISTNQTLPPAPESDPQSFSPSAAAVWVNILWFLSLALSVSVSLVAMLAKQWCYSFMSGRSGQPHIQARMRQRRLEELERWRMPEILAFLPTLIHLSLFLFFVGLVILLWDVHTGVAAPVLATTVLTALFYGFTTILPIFYELCPYNTPLSQFIKASPENFQRLQKRMMGWCQNLARAVSRPTVMLSTFQTWLPGTSPRMHPHHNRRDGQPSDEEADKPVIMDDLTARALAWLMTNSQDIRSVDVALQAIAGANNCLPAKPLIECGAHSLVSQRFRNCFISHPQSGFSFLSNPGLVDVASLYGRALAYFMADGRYASEVETVLRSGPGGGFAIRRAYQCLQYDCSSNRPNISAFGISGLSTWWEMRLHVGQLPPGVLPDALKMLNKHLSGECALHPMGLVALLDTIAGESHHWMRSLEPRDRVQYPDTVLQLLGRLDQFSLGHARPAIAVCLTAFAFTFGDAPPTMDGSHLGPQSPGLRLLRYYASDDTRTRDAEALLVYGLVSLIRDRQAYELGSIEVGNIARQLALLYKIKPPPSGLKFPFMPQGSELNIFAIQIILPILSTNAIGEDARAGLLRVIMLYSYMWGPDSEAVYLTIAETLRLARSNSLKRAWDDWARSEWTTYYAHDMLILLDRHQTFSTMIRTLATPGLDVSAVPFLMFHIWSMADHIIQWQRRSPLRTGRSLSHGTLRSVVSQLIGQGIASLALPSSLEELLEPMLEGWLTRLEAVKERVPDDILNSGILDVLGRSDRLRHLAGRVRALLEYCTSRVTVP